MRTVVTREVEWDDDERANMQALVLFEADRCDGCGGSLTETTALKADEAGFDVHAIRCHACTAIAVRADNTEARQPRALRYWAEPRFTDPS